MVQQAKRGRDTSGLRGSCIDVTNGRRRPRCLGPCALARALGFLGSAAVLGAGCQLVVDSDRFSFTINGPGEIITGTVDPGVDAGTSGADAGSPVDDDETGAATPAPVCDGCKIGIQCVPTGQRRPGNDCEVCDPSRAASTWSNREGACDDGLYCTLDDRCADRACSGAPRPCDDDVACNGTSSCDEQNARCISDENQCPPGQNCDLASDSCTTTCTGCLIDGICVPAGAERAGNPCLVCQPGTSDTAYTSAPGKPCGDAATECSGADTCDVTAVCRPNHLPAETACGSDATSSCAAHDACDGNGQCTLRFQPDFTPCPDSSFCTSAETCQGGTCQLAITSCPSGQSCDFGTDSCRCDNAGCFIADTCVAPGATDPGNACFICDPSRSASAYSPNVGAACGDARQTSCTDPDSCDGSGFCQPNHAGTDTQCSFGGECNEAANCDGNGSCPFIPVNEGGSCDDGIFCNGTERCEGGVCREGRPRPGCIEP